MDEDTDPVDFTRYIDDLEALHQEFPNRNIFAAICHQPSKPRPWLPSAGLFITIEHITRRRYDAPGYTDILLDANLFGFAVDNMYGGMYTAEQLLCMVRNTVNMYYTAP